MKNFRDSWVTDENGHRFVFTVEVQRQLSEAGLPVTPESIVLLKTPPSMPTPAAPKPAPAREKAPFVPNAEPEEIQIDPQTGKYIGRLKWYNPLKGFGFIARGAGEQIFFHKANILCEIEELAQGVWVLYDVEENQKGFEAGEVELYRD